MTETNHCMCDQCDRLKECSSRPDVSESSLTGLLTELNDTLKSFESDCEYAEKVGAINLDFLKGREVGAKHIIRIVERFSTEHS